MDKILYYVREYYDRTAETVWGDVSYDLIFSLGVMGVAVPFNLDIVRKVYRHLTNGGIFFFNTVETERTSTCGRKILTLLFG